MEQKRPIDRVARLANVPIQDFRSVVHGDGVVEGEEEGVRGIVRPLERDRGGLQRVSGKRISEAIPRVGGKCVLLGRVVVSDRKLGRVGVVHAKHRLRVVRRIVASHINPSDAACEIRRMSECTNEQRHTAQGHCSLEAKKRDT